LLFTAITRNQDIFANAVICPWRNESDYFRKVKYRKELYDRRIPVNNNRKTSFDMDLTHFMREIPFLQLHRIYPNSGK